MQNLFRQRHKHNKLPGALQGRVSAYYWREATRAADFSVASRMETRLVIARGGPDFLRRLCGKVQISRQKAALGPRKTCTDGASETALSSADLRVRGLHTEVVDGRGWVASTIFTFNAGGGGGGGLAGGKKSSKMTRTRSGVIMSA